MEKPINQELLPPSGPSSALPALGSPQATDEFMSKVKQILEGMLGRRGGSQWDRVVTFRDLYGMGSLGQGGPFFGSAGFTLAQPSGSDEAFQEFASRVEAEVRKSAAFKALQHDIGNVNDLAIFPDELRALLTVSLEEAARERRADIVRIERKVQTDGNSFTAVVEELTSAIERNVSAIRSVDSTYADSTRAMAGSIKTVTARMDNIDGESTGITIEEKFLAQADVNDGLLGQYSLKIVAGTQAAPVIAGMSISSETPVEGVTTSDIVFLADRLSFFTQLGNIPPFIADASGLLVNGDVRINGSSIIKGSLTVYAADGQTVILNAGGLKAGYEAPGTKNADIVVGGRNLHPDGGFERGTHPCTDRSAGVSNAITSDVVGVYSGTKALFLDTLGGDAYLYIGGPKTSVVAGRQYVLSFMYKTATSGTITGSSTYIRYSNGTDLAMPLPVLNTVQTWTVCEMLWTCPSGVTSIEFRFGIHSTGYSWMVADCIQVEEGNKRTQWTPSFDDVAAETALAATTSTWAGLTGPGKAADNATADITLIAAGAGTAITGNSVTRSGQVGWDGGAFTYQGFAGGASVSFEPLSGGDWMAGLDSNPAQDSSYQNIDYALYGTGNNLYYYESGSTNSVILSGYATGDSCSVTYDGSTVIYMKNRTILRTVSANITAPLGFDSSIINGTLKNIRLVPLSSNADGVDAKAGLANKLNKNADDILGGVLAVNTVSVPVGLRIGNITWNASGVRTGGYGVALTPQGLIGSNTQGVVTFAISAATGNASFGGELTAAYGSFGAVTIAAGGSISSGQSAYNVGTGFWLQGGATPKFSLKTANGASFLCDPGGNVLTFTGATIDGTLGATVVLNAAAGATANNTLNNPPVISGLYDVTFNNAANNVYVNYVTFTASKTGGTGTPTYSWVLSTYFGTMELSATTGATVTVRGKANNLHCIGMVTCTVSCGGITSTMSCEVSVGHGSGVAP